MPHLTIQSGVSSLRPTRAPLWPWGALLTTLDNKRPLTVHMYKWLLYYYQAGGGIQYESRGHGGGDRESEHSLPTPTTTSSFPAFFFASGHNFPPHHHSLHFLREATTPIVGRLPPCPPHASFGGECLHAICTSIIIPFSPNIMLESSPCFISLRDNY